MKGLFVNPVKPTQIRDCSSITSDYYVQHLEAGDTRRTNVSWSRSSIPGL
ncbi:MAG: hypothetical protein ACLVK0_13795 [Parabacteroides merdae]